MEERWALLFFDGSVGVLRAGLGIDEARREIGYSDQNEACPRKATRLVRVQIRIIEIVPISDADEA
ncbi:MAG TPA: hypothetical protein VHY35_20785 [Stellaceae bacterium]|jgi:hypothetical protein|nr:hypothetical protein [Stellaceae bacterium]